MRLCYGDDILAAKTQALKRRKAGKMRAPEADGARERLLAAGDRLFLAKDLNEISVTDIAEEADVARGLVFHYFDSKLDFYVELYRRFSQRVMDRMVHESAAGAPDERLAKVIMVFMDFVSANADTYIHHRRGGAPEKLAEAILEARVEKVRFVHRIFMEKAPTRQQMIMGVAWMEAVNSILIAWVQKEGVSRQGAIDVCVELYRLMTGLSPQLGRRRG